MPPKVVVITGPTATGKTELSVRLANQIGGEIIGADSMQIYKYMDIGTAKPLPAEMADVPHHMIDFLSPFEDYSVARYVEDAAACAADIAARGKIPIIVGGTGLYIESLLSGRDFAEGGFSSGLRAELSAMYDTVGGESMLAQMAGFDPISAKKLHANDKKRIIRAFEVFRTTGLPLSAHDLATQQRPPRFDACKLALTFRDRQDLYDRIDLRVDRMVKAGLISEVQTLLDMGLTADNTAMQAIGYKELAAALLSGSPVDDAVAAIKMSSRRYAKRQLSWLRRDPTIHWIAWEKTPDFAIGLRNSTAFLEEYGIL